MIKAATHPWLLTFVPAGDGPPASVRVRRLLKVALRAYRLRCTRVETGDETQHRTRRACAVVATRARKTILNVMQEAQAKHGDAWKTRNDRIDLEHAKRHLSLVESGDTSELHLEHALCRLALILARRKRK